MSLHQQNFPRPLSTVVIFGPGLIGGSLALALQEKRPDWKLELWARSEESASRARPIFTQVTTDAGGAASRADLCVFCTPLSAMPALARAIAPRLRPDAIVTDAGSAKAAIVEKLEAILGEKFVGSHPMAGSEKSGLGAARAGLFSGSTCILTPTPQTTPAALQAVKTLWQAVGCRLVELSPAAHDEAIARVSHLPHAVAAALVNAIALRIADPGSLAGGGYRDTTRIAAGPPAMWAEILLENRGAVLAGLTDFTQMLEHFQRIVRSGDAAALEEFLARARDARSGLSS